MSFIARMLLIAGGFVASWFYARDALNFPIAAFIVALFLFVAFVAILAFWPTIFRFLRKLFEKNPPQ